MYKFMQRNAAFFIALAPVVLLISLERNFHNRVAFAKNLNVSQKSASDKVKTKKDSKKIKTTVDNLKYTEVVDGNVNSKNEMIILSSLNCESCKKFHNKVYPKLIKYVNDNNLDIKFKFEFYIETAGALEAVKMLSIDKMPNKTKLEIMKLFFAHQEQIEKLPLNKQPVYVQNIAKNLGIDKNKIKAASQSAALEKSIMRHFYKVNKEIQTQYLPTIVLHNQTYNGRVESVDEIVEFIKKNIIAK